MGIDVRPEVLIRRPRAEVAAYMFDPKNDAAWTTGVISCRPLTEGRLRKGSQVERTVKFLGKSFSYLYEVVDAEGDSFVELKVEKPFPMLVRYTLEDAPEGTRAEIRARGDASGFYRLAAPLMAPMVKRNIQKDLELLKKRVEAR
jgi:hypothetical protein